MGHVSEIIFSLQALCYFRLSPFTKVQPDLVAVKLAVMDKAFGLVGT